MRTRNSPRPSEDALAADGGCCHGGKSEGKPSKSNVAQGHEADHGTGCGCHGGDNARPGRPDDLKGGGACR